MKKGCFILNLLQSKNIYDINEVEYFWI